MTLTDVVNSTLDPGSPEKWGAPRGWPASTAARLLWPSPSPACPCNLVIPAFPAFLSSPPPPPGHFHELGHNFQDPAWTWGCTTEVHVVLVYWPCRPVAPPAPLLRPARAPLAARD